MTTRDETHRHLSDPSAAPARRDTSASPRRAFVQQLMGQPAPVQLKMLRPEPPLLAGAPPGLDSSSQSGSDAGSAGVVAEVVQLQPEAVPSGLGDSELIAATHAYLEQTEPWTTRHESRDLLNSELEERAIRRMCGLEPQGSGLLAMTTVDAFVGAMATLEGNWSTMSVGDREAALLTAMNSALSSAQVHGIDTLESAPITARASYSPDEWTVRVRQDFMEADAFPETLPELVYHEARHAEQHYRVMRLLAGRGLEIDEIIDAFPYDVADWVVASAYGDPLPDVAGDAFVDEARRWEAGMIGGHDHFVQVMDNLYQVWGDLQQRWPDAAYALTVFEADPTPDNRQPLELALEELDLTVQRYWDCYGAYRQLVAEDDAHDVGITAVVVFRFMTGRNL
jgi:hypothetical protein